MFKQEKLNWFNETQDNLLKAWNLLQSIKKSWNKEMYEKFSKNYDSLYQNINNAINTDKNISSKERDDIKKELAWLLILAKDNNIDYVWDY